MPSLPRRCLLALSVPLLASSGCGDWWLRITEVSGTIRIDGKPARGVQVVFQPLDASRPRAIAQTDKDGGYRLGRQGPGNRQGAASGKYRVQLFTDTDGPNPVLIPAEYNVIGITCDLDQRSAWQMAAPTTVIASPQASPCR